MDCSLMARSNADGSGTTRAMELMLRNDEICRSFLAFLRSNCWREMIATSSPPCAHPHDAEWLVLFLLETRAHERQVRAWTQAQAQAQAHTSAQVHAHAQGATKAAAIVHAAATSASISAERIMRTFISPNAPRRIPLPLACRQRLLQQSRHQGQRLQLVDATAEAKPVPVSAKIKQVMRNQEQEQEPKQKGSVLSGASSGPSVDAGRSSTNACLHLDFSEARTQALRQLSRRPLRAFVRGSNNNHRDHCNVDDTLGLSTEHNTQLSLLPTLRRAVEAMRITALQSRSHLHRSGQSESSGEHVPPVTTPLWQQDQKLLPLLLQQRLRVPSSKEKFGDAETIAYFESNSDSDSDSDSNSESHSTHSALSICADANDKEQSTSANAEADVLAECKSENVLVPTREIEPEPERKSEPKSHLDSTPERASPIEPESIGLTFEPGRESEPCPDTLDCHSGRCIKLHVKVAGARALGHSASTDTAPESASGLTDPRSVQSKPMHGASSDSYKPTGVCTSKCVQEVVAPYVMVACRCGSADTDEHGPWERAIGSTATKLKNLRQEERSNEDVLQQVQQGDKHKRERQLHEWRWHDHFNFICELPGHADSKDSACVRLLLRVLDANQCASADAPDQTALQELTNCIGEASAVLQFESKDMAALLESKSDHNPESKRMVWRCQRWLSLQRGGVAHRKPTRLCATKSGHVHSRHELEHEYVHPDDSDDDTMVYGEIDVTVTMRVCNKHEDTDGCERNSSSSPSPDPAAAVGARRVICIAADTLMLSVRGPTSARPGPVRVLSSNNKQLHEGDVIIAIRLWESVSSDAALETVSNASKATEQDSNGTPQAGNSVRPRHQLHTYRTATLLFEDDVVPLLKRLKKEGGELIIFASPMIQISDSSSSTTAQSTTPSEVAERHSSVDHGELMCDPTGTKSEQSQDEVDHRPVADGRPRMLEARAQARARRRTMREVQEKAAAAAAAAAEIATATASTAAKSSRPRLSTPTQHSRESEASLLSRCRIEKLHFFRMSVRTRKRSGINSHCNSAGENSGNVASTLVASPASTTSAASGAASVASSKSANHHHENIMCTAVLDLNSRQLLFYKSPSGVPLILSGNVRPASARATGKAGRMPPEVTAATRRGVGNDTTSWLRGGIPLSSIRSVLPDNEPDIGTRRIFVLLQKGQSLELRCQSARVATEFCRCVLDNINTLSESTSAATQQLPLSSPIPPRSIGALSVPALLGATSADSTESDYGFIGNVFMRCSAMSPTNGGVGSDTAKWGARTLLLCNHCGVLVAFDPSQGDLVLGHTMRGSDVIDLAETPPLFALHLDGLVLHHQGAKSFVLRPRVFVPGQTSDSISVRVGIARRATASASASDSAAMWISKLRNALHVYSHAHNTEGSEHQHRRHRHRHLHVDVEDPNDLRVTSTVLTSSVPSSPSAAESKLDSASIAAAACADAKERCLRADFEGARAVLHAAFTRTDDVRGADMKTGSCAQLHTWLTAVHSFIVAFIERRTLSPAQRAGLLLKATNTGALELFQVHLVELLLDTASACTEAGLVFEAQKLTRTLTALNEEHESSASPKSSTAFAASSPSLLSPTQMRRLHTLKQRASTRNTGGNVTLLRRRTAAGTSRPSPRTPRRWRR